MRQRIWVTKQRDDHKRRFGPLSIDHEALDK